MYTQNQEAAKGHVVTLPQDVQQLADVLPRCPKDLPVIIFTINEKDNSFSDFVERHKKVEEALNWLTGEKGKLMDNLITHCIKM